MNNNKKINGELMETKVKQPPVKMKCRWCKKIIKKSDPEFPMMCEECTIQKKKNSRKYNLTTVRKYNGKR